MTSSPDLSYSVISVPSIERSLASTAGSKLPLEPNQMSSAAVDNTTVLVSVIPVVGISCW